MADTDDNGLYNESMGSGFGGITRSGSSGSYTYAAISGRENMPVNYVSFYDALRFANWLHNGQPTGSQDGTTTEDGAYTMIAEDYLSDPLVVITRNTGAQVFLPSEDEWYKAAYYNAVSTSYLDYPTGTDTLPTCALPGTTANTANCGKIINSPTGDVTSVGGYPNSASPYGSFDQGGNLWEMNEAIVVAGDPATGRRVVRGGGWNSNPLVLGVAVRGNRPPGSEDEYVGFRVAMIPEPSTALLIAGGLAGLAAAVRRRSLR